MFGVRLSVFALAGLLFGSFLTVVTYRVPRGQSVVAPRSACPNCGTAILARDNVPVLSYLLLRGRCRQCHSHISAEYPAIEALTAALFVAAALVFRRVETAVIVAPFLGIMVATAVIDAHHRIIPNRIVYTALPLFAALILIVDVAGGRPDILGALLGFLAFGGGLFAVALISPRGMGMGDVKLAALMGLVLGALGWRYVGVAILVAILAGGIGAIVALVAGRSRKDTIPFGPYLAGGGIVSALLAPQIAAWYTGLLH
jgi:leader peptidase (prepilin peptidase) / N-methyltransferase